MPGKSDYISIQNIQEISQNKLSSNILFESHFDFHWLLYL